MIKLYFVLTVGARNVKSVRIYDVADPKTQRKLPQHDFSPSEVYQTPASFRIMSGRIETVIHEGTYI